MKKLFSIGCVLVLTLPHLLSASTVPVNMISEQYHIRGQYAFTQFQPPQTCLKSQDSYNITAAEPISNQIISWSDSHGVSSYSNVNRFSLSAAATGLCSPGLAEANSLAIAEWLFTPKTDTLKIKLDCWGNINSFIDVQAAAIIITDLTSDIQLVENSFSFTQLASGQHNPVLIELPGLPLFYVPVVMRVFHTYSPGLEEGVA